MALLTRFSAPGHAELPDPEGWSDRLVGQLAQFTSLPRFFSPLEAEGSPTAHP